MNKRKVYRNLVILAVTLAFILIFTMITQFVILSVESVKSEKLNSEIEKLNEQIEGINEEVEYKKTMMYIEKYAREKLDLYGDGDVIFIPKS